MKRTTPSLSRRLAATGLAVAAITIAACTKNDATTAPSLVLAPRIAITSVEGDTASALLSAIYARAMENAGVRVVRKDPVAMDRTQYMQAILDGQFQMIPDFSRDVLAEVLSGTPTDSTTVTTEAATATTRAPITIPTTTTAPATSVPTTDTGATTSVPTTDTGATTSAASTTGVDTTVTTVPDTTVPATTVAPSTSGESTTTTIAPTNAHSISAQIVAINSTIDSKLLAYGATVAEHRTVIACTTTFMQAQAAYQLYTLTDLASLAPSTRFAAPAAYIGDDAEGLPQLLRVYAAEFAATLTIEGADVAAAIDADTADCFAVDSFDGVITAKNLTILFDDQYMVPMNMAIALMAATAATPEVTAALDKVASALSTDNLNQMLREIEENGTDITVVANAFVDNIPTASG